MQALLTRILSARLKKLLFLGGLHSPCDNYTFQKDLYGWRKAVPCKVIGGAITIGEMWCPFSFTPKTRHLLWKDFVWPEVVHWWTGVVVHGRLFGGAWQVDQDF